MTQNKSYNNQQLEDVDSQIKFCENMIYELTDTDTPNYITIEKFSKQKNDLIELKSKLNLYKVETDKLPILPITFTPSYQDVIDEVTECLINYALNNATF